MAEYPQQNSPYKKARGVTTPSGYALTQAGNDRGYAIASCIAANDSA
jgi:hypothetical protein